MISKLLIFRIFFEKKVECDAKNLAFISRKKMDYSTQSVERYHENFVFCFRFFQMSLKVHNQLTEDDRINYFHSLMRGDALQTFKNVNGPTHIRNSCPCHHRTIHICQNATTPEEIRPIWRMARMNKLSHTWKEN